MPGEIVNIEIPADDTAQAREFWGSLFGWTFENYPGPSEYHMTRLSESRAPPSARRSRASVGRAPTSTSTTSRRARRG
jgi:predicted enzyme related to lactoylglutathione lyase